MQYNMYPSLAYCRFKIYTVPYVVTEEPQVLSTSTPAYGEGGSSGTASLRYHTYDGRHC